MLSPNTILQDRYRIVRELGRGGMGTVYEAIDQRVNCVVALKETLANSNPKSRSAFEREAALLANLRHACLPKVTDYFSDRDAFFLVMEFIPGHDFAELLDLRRRPFSEAEVVYWADQLLDLLTYLHSKNLLHRDIKPPNLKLTAEGELFLLDFGLAKGAVGQMPTMVETKSVHGYTLQYSSLEQILRQGTDPRSDLYSLGATLYHLLTGVLPIDAHTRARLLSNEGRDPLPLIQKENPEVSAGVAAIIHSAMQIEASRRPASADEMRRALMTATTDVPREPRRPTPPPPSTIKSPYADPTPPAYPIPTMRVDAPPNVSPFGSSRIFSYDEARLEERKSAGIAKPMGIVIGAVLLLILLSVALAIWRTGWAPWSKQNLYANDNANPSGSPISASAETPTPTPSPSPALAAMVHGQGGIDLVLIKPGSFLMGSSSESDFAKPVRRVTIAYSFYLGKYEVTQTQWLRLMGTNPSHNPCLECPVEEVSWYDAKQFIAKLNELDNKYEYRLPSEAEWEYACRAGSTGKLSGELDRMIKRGAESTYPVGQTRPNSWGLYDMYGNVWEWCEDWYHPNYSGAPTDGSPWLSTTGLGHVSPGASLYEIPLRAPEGLDQSGRARVLRGGAWNYPASSSATRNASGPDYRGAWSYGLRVVAMPRSN